VTTQQADRRRRERPHDAPSAEPASPRSDAPAATPATPEKSNMPEGDTESAAPMAKPIRRRARRGGRGTASVAPEPATLRAIKSQVSLEELFPNYAREAFARKVAEERQQWITEAQNAYLSQGLVLYRGAGVSMSIGLPSWNELTHSLTVTMMSRNIHSAARRLEGLRDVSRTEALKALLEEVKQRRNPRKPILMMAQAIKDELGDDLPSQVAVHLYGRLGGGLSSLWTRLLGGIFGGGFRRLEKPGEIQLPTSPLLEAIVALTRYHRDVRGVQAIVNCNYAEIVEERLRQEAVPCTTVRSRKNKQPRGSPPSYHVHGAPPVRACFKLALRANDSDTGSFVFSEDEYRTEYADPYRWSNLTQIGLLERHKGLFIGLSLQDPILRRLIDVTHKQYPEIWNYAILPRSPAPSNEDAQGLILSNLSDDVEARSFRKIGVKVIWIDDVTKDVAPLLDKIREIPAE
jgi:hypothetical protein